MFNEFNEKELREKLEAFERMLKRSNDAAKREGLEKTMLHVRRELEFKIANREQRATNKRPKSPASAPKKTPNPVAVAAPGAPEALAAPHARRQKIADDARAAADTLLQRLSDALRKAEESRRHEEAVRRDIKATRNDKQVAFDRTMMDEQIAQDIQMKADTAVAKADNNEADVRKAEATAAAHRSSLLLADRRPAIQPLTDSQQRCNDAAKREGLEEKIRTVRIELDFEKDNHEQCKHNKQSNGLKRKASTLEASEASAPPMPLEASEVAVPHARRQKRASEARAKADFLLQKAQDAQCKAEEFRRHEYGVSATTMTPEWERRAVFSRMLDAEKTAQDLEKRASLAAKKAEKMEADVRKAESVAAARLSNNSAEQSMSCLADPLPSFHPLTDSQLLPPDLFDTNEQIPTFPSGAPSSLSQLLLAESACWQAGNDNLEDIQEPSKVGYQGAVNIHANRGFEHTNNGDETEETEDI